MSAADREICDAVVALAPLTGPALDATSVHGAFAVYYFEENSGRAALQRPRPGPRR
jgi:hypothetical protein